MDRLTETLFNTMHDNNSLVEIFLFAGYLPKNGKIREHCTCRGDNELNGTSTSTRDKRIRTEKNIIIFNYPR